MNQHLLKLEQQENVWLIFRKILSSRKDPTITKITNALQPVCKPVESSTAMSNTTSNTSNTPLDKSLSP